MIYFYMNTFRLYINTRFNRNYSVLELQKKYENFTKIPVLNPGESTPLERKIHQFVTRMNRSKNLNKECTIIDGEVVNPGLKGKPNMRNLITDTYNWNPYTRRVSNNASRTEKGTKGSISNESLPNEYRQSGWGMQPQPRRDNNPDIYKMFPNTSVLKNIINDGNRLNNLGHLVTNPLRELGYRDNNIENGRDFNVIERVLNPMSDNIVESWHGIDPIHSQFDDINDMESSEYIENQDLHYLTKEQYTMRQLKINAKKSYELKLSLPPFKYGFEDVPVLIEQKHIHAPDYIGDAKRTRELKAILHVNMEHIFPEIKGDMDPNNKNILYAIKMICGRRFNKRNNILTISCEDNYFYIENEDKIVNILSKLITEIQRLSKCLNSNDLNIYNPNTNNKIIKWEEYFELYKDNMNHENIKRKYDKERWLNEMISMPVHIRSNFNLYNSGLRMQKVTKYCDLYYNKMIDAGNLLQKEGPKMYNSMTYYKKKIRNKYKSFLLPDNTKHGFFRIIDDLPNNINEYSIKYPVTTYIDRHNNKISQHKFDYKDLSHLYNSPENIEFFNASDPPNPLGNIKDYPRGVRKRLRRIPAPKKLPNNWPIFGLKSGYQIPQTDVIKYCGNWNVPLAQPFVGLRLRKNNITPTSSSTMMKIYNRHPNVRKPAAMKMIFGHEYKQNIYEIEDKEAKKIEILKQKRKAKRAQMGGKRAKKERDLKKQKEEQLLLEKKKYFDKNKNLKTEKDGIYNYMHRLQKDAITRTEKYATTISK